MHLNMVGALNLMFDNCATGKILIGDVTRLIKFVTYALSLLQELHEMSCSPKDSDPTQRVEGKTNQTSTGSTTYTTA